MIVLSVHNFYQQPGGEDEAFRQEARLLEQHGHEVIRYHVHNDQLNSKARLDLLRTTIYNSTAYRQVRSLIQDRRPDIMHVHNTFPLLSPAVYYAAASERVPVVQTLHNYRLLCPAAVLYRNGKTCERCVETASPWPAVMHSCYRGSRSASAAAASMLTIHRLLRTYTRVSTYVALSEFSAEKFLRAGIPQSKVIVKPNFIAPDPGPGSGHASTPAYCLFAGRLTAEKGVRTLLDAWTQFSPPMDLEIAGDGELAGEVAAAAEQNPRIRWHGRLRKEQLYERIEKAAALIVPSTWYEPFGIVLIEAFAMSVPVIASNIGALGAMVTHLRNGLHFEAGDAGNLAAQVRWLHEHPHVAVRMRHEARREFELRYTGERNYSLLMKIYAETMRRHGGDECSEPTETLEEVDGQLVQIAGHFRSRAQVSADPN